MSTNNPQDPVSSPSFLEILRSYRTLIWPEIETYLTSLKTLPQYCQISPQYQPLFDLHLNMVNEYPKRMGKYLRPSLVMLTAQSLGVDSKVALKTAAAMQLSEEWILCHDDIEDDSEARRGAPSLHKLFSKELAINAGDQLQTLQWKILFDNYDLLGQKKGREIADEFFRMFNRTYLGQTIDIKWSQDPSVNLSDDDVFMISESKTGYYTIAGPMRLGAILADATSKQLDALYRFGVLLGRVFQLTDDILDVTSDFEGLKKQQGNDIYENKKTIMLVQLLRSANQDDQKIITGILQKTRSQKTPDDVATIIKLMEKYGSIDYARSLAKKFSSDCLTLFDSDLSFLKNEPYRSHLRSGIEFILNRTH